MVSRDEALALVRQWLGADGGVEIGLYEFDLGYVGYPIEPEVASTGAPPPGTGVVRVIVDKETGKLTQGPSLPPMLVAEQYARQAAAAERYPEDVLAALLAAGWRPGRDVSTSSVPEWSTRNADALAGLERSDAAVAVLTEFGGLRLEQAGPSGRPDGGFPSRIFPADGRLVTDGVRGFTERTGISAFPIGDHEDGPSDLVIAPDGRVFLLHWADDFFVGADFDEALVWLVRGGEILPVADDGTY